MVEEEKENRILLPPYTQGESDFFIVTHSHRGGKLIKEIDSVLYAVEKNEMVVDGEIVINPDYVEDTSFQQEEIKFQLSNLDRQSIRSLRAILSAENLNEVEEDIQVLTSIEAQAKDLRKGLTDGVE